MTVTVSTGVDTDFITEQASALVGRLRTTFRTERTKPLAWRKRQLSQLRALLTENRDDIVGALRTDLHKSRAEVDSLEIGATLVEIDGYLEHLEEWLRPRPAAVTVPGFPEGSRARTQFDPLGVALVVSAWNYPVNLLLVPVAGALASLAAVQLGGTLVRRVGTRPTCRRALPRCPPRASTP